MDQQQTLIRALVDEVSAQAPPGWSTMDLLFIAAGRGLRYEVELDIDAAPRIHPHAMVMALRDAMYRPGRGTWFSMRLEIAAGEVTTTFEYGNPGHPLGAALEEDLVLYPRDTVPGWIATALAEPAGPATAHRTHAEMDAATPTTARHDTNSPLFQAALNAFEPDEPGMVYAKLTRKKQSDATPAEIFIEVGTDGYETRRVEVFPDGSADNASFDFDGERTRIDPNPVLPLTETVDGRYFVMESIAPSEFQAEWLAVEGLD